MPARSKRTRGSLDQTDLFESPTDNVTGWTLPEEYPRLSGRIALDLETKDPGMKQYGPGWCTRNGHIAGVAVAVPEGPAWYLPIRHPMGGNFDPGRTLRWLRDQLPNVTEVVGHKLTYDLGWLQAEGVVLPDTIQCWDTAAMGALVDENRYKYSLDALGTDYVGEQKRKDLLEAYATRWGLGKPGENIWCMPSFIVGPYAEQDAALTLRVFSALEPILTSEQLWPVMRLEMALLPVLLAMRTRGVRVDERALAQRIEHMTEQEADARDRIKQLTGKSVDPWDPHSLATALGTRGIVPGKTSTGDPSITKEFLAACQDEVAGAILRLRQVNKVRTTFLEGAFVAHLQQGRLYPEFHALRGDDGGAVTGRFSSSNPNAQQFPARREEEARLVRGLLIPEAGATWFAADYNQQEPRMLVHFASLLGLRRAAEAVQAYRQDRRTDFHQFVADLTGLPRKQAKNINLGKFYGMGPAKYARSVGLPTAWVTGRDNKRREVAGPEAQAQLDQYNAHLPFVEQLYQECQTVARDRGYIRTIGGRRRRFQPLHPKGASGHKALNAVIQGSSADQNKMAMVALFRAGYCPSVVVHDEIDGSCTPDDVPRIQEIMETCLTLQVPSVVDVATGDTWGDAL